MRHKSHQSPGSHQSPTVATNETPKSLLTLTAAFAEARMWRPCAERIHRCDYSHNISPLRQNRCGGESAKHFASESKTCLPRAASMASSCAYFIFSRIARWSNSSTPSGPGGAQRHLQHLIDTWLPRPPYCLPRTASMASSCAYSTF